MTRLSKEAWAKPSLKTKEVEVSDLGGTVLVRELPSDYAAEVNEHVKMIQSGREQTSQVELKTMNRLKFAYGVINDDGEPLFTEDEVRELMAKHGRAVSVVIEAIDDLSAIGEEGFKKAEARFPSGGIRENGSAVSDQETAGPDRPSVRARAGA